MAEKKKEDKYNKEKKGHGKVLSSWEFPEYEQFDRSKTWIIVFGILCSAAIIWSVVTGNFLFAIIVLMLIVITLTHHYNKPGMVEFQITEDGLQLGGHYYDYEELDTFWIIYEPGEVKKLYFHFKSWLHPRLGIPLNDQNPIKIRSILLKYLEEDLDQDSEPTTDALGRRWKLH